jgi:hypothetical protein
MKPPEFLDGARVLEWAWSGDQPFGYMKDDTGQPVFAIHGQAICQYDGQTGFYRFTCDKNWEVVNDSDCDSVEEAKDSAEQMYRVSRSHWNRV